MKSRLVWDKAGARTFVLVLEAGEETFAVITDFAAREGLHGASLSALGALERAVVGWFDGIARRHRKLPVEQQCEVVSAIGEIAAGLDRNPSLRLHAVLGLSDGTTRGGHLLEAIARANLEVTVNEVPAHRRRNSHAPTIAAAARGPVIWSGRDYDEP